MIKNIISEEIKKFIIENYNIDESGYSRLMNMAAGNVDSVNTIGILTSENPDAVQAEPVFNKKALNQLKSDLKNMGLGFIPIDGKYGSDENSLIVPNITLNQILDLGKKYKQESVIFAEKKEQADKVFFKWRMLNSYNGQDLDSPRYTVLSSRLTNKYKGSGKDRKFDKEIELDNFYSMIQNRQFRIPFYDKKHKNPDYKRMIDKNQNT